MNVRVARMNNPLLTRWTPEAVQVFARGDAGNKLAGVTVTVQSPPGLMSSAAVPVN